IIGRGNRTGGVVRIRSGVQVLAILAPLILERRLAVRGNAEDGAFADGGGLVCRLKGNTGRAGMVGVATGYDQAERRNKNEGREIELVSSSVHRRVSLVRNGGNRPAGDALFFGEPAERYRLWNGNIYKLFA